MARPSVVLPEPDSPTTPTVSPSRTLTETPSTALTNPTVLRKKPRLMGNQTRMSLASRMVLRGQIDRGRRAFRFGGDQRLRVGMARRRENLRHSIGFDDFAFLHHRDIVGDFPDDAEVMGNEEHRHVVARLQVLQKLEDLSLHGNIEGGCRLVGDEKIGPVGERHGDHHPLALAAGELMRIGVEPRRRDRECRLPAEARRCGP